MNPITKELSTIFEELNEFIENYNKIAEQEGSLTIQPQEIKIVGKMDLFFRLEIFEGVPDLIFSKLERLLETQGIQLKKTHLPLKSIPSHKILQLDWISVLCTDTKVMMNSKTKFNQVLSPTTQKVLSRLSYEKLLITTHSLTPQRVKISLENALEAAKEEPRIYATLPAIILNKPSIFSRPKLREQVKKNQKINKKIQNLLKGEKGNFFDIDATECIQLATTFEKYLATKRKKQKALTMNLRLSEGDYLKLKEITKYLQSSGLSETIRNLVEEKYRTIKN